MYAITSNAAQFSQPNVVNSFNVQSIVANRLMGLNTTKVINKPQAAPKVLAKASPLAKYEAMNFSALELAFENLERYLKNVATGDMRGLIVTGPPGVGKTTAVTKMLNANTNKAHKLVAGHMSVITLYCELFRHSAAGEIVVLDDVDSAFSSIEGINVVKAAADTVGQRRISWATNSPILTAWGVPRTFEYNGSIILISNETERVGKKGKMASHIAAIKDRLHSLPLGSNDRNEQFHQLCFQVVRVGLLSNRGLSSAQQCDVLDFIDHHLTELDRVSLRTATKLADLMTLEPRHWRSMANISMLNNIDHAGGN